jgi:hypothetical protein
VLLALPVEGEGRADEIARLLRRLLAPGADIVDLIICDGPNPGDSAVAGHLEQVDAVVTLEDEADVNVASSCWSALAGKGIRVAATVQFMEPQADQGSSADGFEGLRA